MIAEARKHVAAALTALPVPVHPYPPQALRAPLVVIIPGFPYYHAATLGGAVDIALQVQVMTSNPQSLDDLIPLAVHELIAAGLHPQPVPEPIPDPESGLLTARIPVVLTWKE